MSIPSTYHLHNSLPNRSETSRPRSMSLAEYQPLTFDREALESAYQTAIHIPTSSSTSWQSHPSVSSDHASNETHMTIPESPSTLSSQLKPGDNPHLPPPPPFTGVAGEPGGFAGVGAGHSLTPPGSPFHKSGQVQQQVFATTNLPTPPTTSSDQFHDGHIGGNGAVGKAGMFKGKGRSGRKMSHDYGNGLDMDDFEAAGYDTDPGPVVSGQRRALPQVPTNVPAPQLPAWEYASVALNFPPGTLINRNLVGAPLRLLCHIFASSTDHRPDYKAHIPSELTQPSIQDAYAQLSAPPPNLPPRRNGHPQNGYYADDTGGPSGMSYPDAGSSGSRPPAQTVMSSSTIGTGVSSLPPGAPDLPPSSTSIPSTSPSTISRPRPEAEKEVSLRSTERTPIWSTHYLDPCLRNPLVNIPQQVTNIANAALSGFNSGAGKERGDAPMDGLAKMAREWVVPPDGRFHSENGGVELAIGVIDSGMQGWGRDKGRKKARVEVVTKSGGVKFELIELDSKRQIELKIDTKTGDVLLLLPANYHGPIHVTSPARPPIILPTLQAQLLPVSSPYKNFYTTFAVPLAFVREHNTSVEHETEVYNQTAGGYAPPGQVGAVGPGEQSKVVVSSLKGRVVIGYRETRDENAAAGMDLRVGAQAGSRKKRWWK